MDGSVSPLLALPCGVLQGSILAPLLLNLYVLPLAAIKNIYIYLVNYLLYADDCQLHFSLKPHESVHHLLDCLADIKNWLTSNFLLLHNDKTGHSFQPQLTLLPTE